jgi:hypothetical protein
MDTNFTVARAQCLDQLIVVVIAASSSFAADTLPIVADTRVGTELIEKDPSREQPFD